MSDLKLCNVGAVSAGAPFRLNKLVGTHGVIERITLYDGRNKLDEVRRFDIYAGFKNTRHENENCEEIQQQLIRNRMGERYTSAYQVNSLNASGQVTADVTTSALGTLNLRYCLPILNALSVLPHSVFQNLRLEVEYHSDVRKFGAVDNIDFTNADPILKVNKVEDEVAMVKLMKTFESVAFNAIEHDEYTLGSLGNAGNGTNGGTAQPNSQKLNGFNGKNIQRMALVKQYASMANVNAFTGNTVQGYGNSGSIVGCEETLQVRVNGANVLPSTYTGCNSLTALTNDTWNTQTSYPSSNNVNFGNVNTLVEGGTLRRGQLGYLGLFIGTDEPVQDLQIEYGRNALNHGNANLSVNQALKITVFCEIPKSFIFKNGEYNLVYN
tara:strand:- start:3913 stop:5058 length:1146 start_codon:yes stop_codon:yes gene_type:complete